jgi:hypothetical protein
MKTLTQKPTKRVAFGRFMKISIMCMLVQVFFTLGGAKAQAQSLWCSVSVNVLRFGPAGGISTITITTYTSDTQPQCTLSFVPSAYHQITSSQPYNCQTFAGDSAVETVCQINVVAGPNPFCFIILDQFWLSDGTLGYMETEPVCFPRPEPPRPPHR